ncbi:hypothetical protein QOT17_021106 [Balamuthia mandrillaris]
MRTSCTTLCAPFMRRTGSNPLFLRHGATTSTRFSIRSATSTWFPVATQIATQSIRPFAGSPHDKDPLATTADIQQFVSRVEQGGDALAKREMLELQKRFNEEKAIEVHLPKKESPDALQRYSKIGEVLEKEEEVQSLSEFLKNLDSEHHRFDETTHYPFVFVEGSSGIGKSQLPFALRSIPTLHLFTTASQNLQPLYSDLSNLRKAFLQCLSRDTDLLEEKKVHRKRFDQASSPGYLGTWQDLLHCSFKNIRLETCGLVAALVDRALELGAPNSDNKRNYFTKMYTEGSTLHYRPMTPSELLQRMKAIRASFEPAKAGEEKKILPVFFLDETPRHTGVHPTSYYAPLARNILRFATLTTVLMGTNSSMLNFHTTGPDSSGQAIWCFVVSRLPNATETSLKAAGLETVMSNLPEDTRDFFVQAALCSRPRFAEFLALAVKKLQPQPKTSSLDRVNSLLAKVGRFMFSHKSSIEESSGGRLAQWMMFLEAAYKQQHMEPNSLSLPTGVIHEHLAHVMYPSLGVAGAAGIFPLVAERKRLRYVPTWSPQELHALLADQVRDVEVWNPHCAFPPPKDDAMLSLCLMGQVGLPAFRLPTRGEARQSLAQRWVEVWQNVPAVPHPQLVKGKLSGPINTGEALEDLIHGAVTLASHDQGLGGVPFDRFLLALCGELDEAGWKPQQWRADHSPEDQQKKHPCLARARQTLIPFCAPPGQGWPDALQKAARQFNGFLGETRRPENQQRHDITVLAQQNDTTSELVMTCEQKDRATTLGPVPLANLPIPAPKLPDGSKKTTPLHIVVAWKVTQDTTGSSGLSSQKANYWLVDRVAPGLFQFVPFNKQILPILPQAQTNVVVLSLENLGFPSWR